MKRNMYDIIQYKAEVLSRLAVILQNQKKKVKFVHRVKLHFMIKLLLILNIYK